MGMLIEEMVGEWVHRVARCVVSANPTVYENGVCNDGSYMSHPIFILSVINEGIYYVSDIGQDRAGFLSHEWLDGSWVEWPVEMDAPAIAAKFVEEA